MHSPTENRTKRVRSGYLLAVIGLLFCLLAPSTSMAQGLKDEPDDPEATVETDFPTSEEAGLIDDRSYESPQYGYTVEWNRDWAVDDWYDQPDEGLQPVMSNEDSGVDTIYLMWVDDEETPVYVIISSQNTDRGGVQAEIGEWTDPDYIEDQWSSNFEVEPILDGITLGSAAVLYSIIDTDDGSQYYTIYQWIEMEDGNSVYLTFSGYEDWLEDGYDSYVSDILVNGEPIAAQFTWAEIEEAIADQ